MGADWHRFPPANRSPQGRNRPTAYLEPVSGARYVVTRPPTWSCDEEAEYVAGLRRCLLADGEARAIPDLSDES
jgi:hypothetical protein